MRFMCTVIVDTELADRFTPEDWASMGARSQAYDRDLMARGIFVAAEALQGAGTARTVRVRSGAARVTDGPYAPGREQIAGFILIDVADAEAALEVARAIPMAAIGAVELRPVMQFDD